MKKSYVLALLAFTLPVRLGKYSVLYDRNIIFLMDIPLLMAIYYIITSGKLRINTYTIIAIIIMSWSVFSNLFSSMPWLGRFYADPKYIESLEIIRAFLVFLAFSSLVEKRRDFYVVGLSFLSISIFEVLLGVYQWKFGPLGLSKIGETYWGWRSSGTFPHPNTFGTYLMLIFPYLFNMIFLKSKRLNQIMIIIFISLISLAIITTYSRTSWIAFIFSISVLSGFKIFTSAKFRRDFIRILPLLLIFLGIISFHFKDRILLRFQNSSTELTSHKSTSRLSLAKDAIRIIKENPIIGVGMGKYKYYASQKITGFRVVHNNFLLICAETGVIGLILYLIMFYLTLRASYKMSHAKFMFFNFWGLSSLMALINFAIESMFQPDYTFNIMRVHIWALMGLIVAAEDIEHGEIRKLKAILLKMKESK